MIVKITDAPVTVICIVSPRRYSGVVKNFALLVNYRACN